MAKGILIVGKSKRGKITVAIEQENGKVRTVSEVRFEDTSLNNMACLYETDKSGRLILLKDENGKVLYKRAGNAGREKRINNEGVDNNLNIFSADKAILPIDTRELLQAIEPENFTMKLNKMVNMIYDPVKKEYKIYLYKAPYKGQKFEIEAKFDDSLIQNIQNKNKNAAIRLFGNDTNCFDEMFFKPAWRLAVGLGNASVYETSITLHTIYGLPYIPASSIKGVVRNWIITSCFSKDTFEPAEYWALKDENFCKIFGTSKETRILNSENKEFVVKSPLKDKNNEPSAYIGEVIFIDAFPKTIPVISPDIMNVHYPDYYGKDNVAPTDFQKLNPIVFLTIKDTTFQFLVGSHKKKLTEYTILGKTIPAFLKEALSEHGIGAKTAVGYGRMI